MRNCVATAAVAVLAACRSVGPPLGSPRPEGASIVRSDIQNFELAKMIWPVRAYYASICANTLSNDVEAMLRRVFTATDTLIDQMVFPTCISPSAGWRPAGRRARMAC